MAWLRRALFALGVLGGVWIARPVDLIGTANGASQVPATEVRALWVTRSSLTSPAAIARVVRTAHQQGFNTLLVQVRGRADAYFTSTLEPRSADLARQPASFDPLATVLNAARERGIRVHAWISLNLVSSATELPASPDHLVYRHPEWLMVPRAIAQDVARLDPGNPAYVGKIARWTRAENGSVEGLYATPLQPEAVAHAARVAGDLARRYALDGVHLDYSRYPNQRFDYSRFAIAAFRADIRPRLAVERRRALDTDAKTDLFAYPDAFPAEWKAFRRARMTALVARVRQAIISARPGTIISSAVFPDAQEAFDERLQDWRGWLDTRLVDAVAPMAYTQEPERFAEQIGAARELAGTRAVWAGIGAYRLTPAQTVDHIRATRKLGVAGFALFSYDSLTGPTPPARDYLETVSRAAFASSRATDDPSKQ